jgi:hypothetical protein
MVDAGSHLKVLPVSILTLDRYKVFEHIDMLSMGIHQEQPFTVIPTLLGSYFGVLGDLWLWRLPL